MSKSKTEKLELCNEDTNEVSTVDALKICIDGGNREYFSPCASCEFYKCDDCGIYEDLCQICWFSVPDNLKFVSEEVHKIE